MSLKVLFITFLVLASLSAICNVAVTALKTPMLCSQNEPLAGSHLILGGDGNEPEQGDPRGGDGWP